MIRFRCLAVLLLVLGWLVSLAHAQPINDIRLNAGVWTGNPDHVTGKFAVFAFDDQTLNVSDKTSVDDLGVGTNYVDYGHAVVVGLRDENNRSVSETGGLGTEWVIWVDWEIHASVTDVEHSAAGDIYYVEYTEGIVKAYVGSPDWDFGTDQSPDDDTWPSSYQLVMLSFVDVESSFGYILYDPNTDTLFRNASVNLDVLWTLPGFFVSEEHGDLFAYAMSGMLFGLTTESASSGLSNWEDRGGYVAIAASGTGSMQFALHSQPVPEPASILLAGAGLLGIGALVRKLY